MALETFGTLLRKYRKEGGINQTTAAKRVGISRHTLINWESGLTQPRHRDQVLDYARDVLRLNYEQTNELLWEAFEQGITEGKRRKYFPGSSPTSTQNLSAGQSPRDVFVSAAEEKPPWTKQAIIWLIFLAISLLGLVGLGYLLLGTISPLVQDIAIVAVGTLLALVGVLEFPARGEHFRALGQGLYDHFGLRVGVVLLFLVTPLLWVTVGRSAYCRAYPCGERIVLIESFVGRDLEQDEVDEALGLTTVRLQGLLRRTNGLYVMNEVDEFTLSQINLQIEGYYEGKHRLRLVAELMDRMGNPLNDAIQVSDDVYRREDVEALQKQLVGHLSRR